MSSLQQVFRGRVWKFGDSVDTNQMAPSGLAGQSMRQAMREHCLRGLRPDFNLDVRPGDIIVAGVNFGCGSSRQTAVEALQECGVAVVLAESVARIHRRNSISLGLPTFVVPGITGLISDGGEIEVDYSNRRMLRGGQAIAVLPSFPPSVERVYEAGGLSGVLRQRLMDHGYMPVDVLGRSYGGRRQRPSLHE
jgi:3-isopropylmalate/(R)-2-methylmalate dehydratase small subunit